ncbi:hypothetical protein FHS18_005523 [Paenibacillus phyllosphaerae]|uniref:Chromosome segregation ATPase n=1 Tax=Paenibacillus phyllosphaerae TaxID=274593 RepID=A0A7W5FQG2_9BACL|nr:hypothetical protein [Paenibacillus phyllosphaerae]MBB3113411.1 hypothetical protein [Paenibacillus phyllosphaerae]
MPRINRLRIAGLKYDGMRKQYDDEIFDFHNDQEACHALISFINSGGKGVLLQTMFQVMKPGTSWGEKDNRRYQQFFFNEREKFQPYTFHVAMEWELDGKEKRYLIAGGVYTAERIASRSEDDNDFEIKSRFLMYTKELDIGDSMLFAFLPFKKGSESTTLTDMDSWLKPNGFETFEQTKRYHDTLRMYSIDPRDWDVMKEINKYEAGVGKYFEGAEDDYSLVRKKVIPMASHRIRQNDTDDDLVDIFKSQASIAKNLPVLISRESAHREFLSEAEPLVVEAEKSVIRENEEAAHELQGKRLLAALQFLISQSEEKQAVISAQLKKVEKQIRTLRYEQDNLRYARLARMIEQLHLTIAEKSKDYTQLLAEHAAAEVESSDARFAVQLRKWSDHHADLEGVKDQIRVLTDSSDAKEIAKELEASRIRLEASWSDLSTSFADEAGKYQQLERRLNEDYRVAGTSVRKSIEAVSNITAAQVELQRSRDKFTVRQKQIIEGFGSLAETDAEALYAIVNQTCQEAKHRQERARSEVHQAIHALNDLKISESIATAALDYAEKEAANLTAEITKREAAEGKLLNHLLSIVQQPFETFDRPFAEAANMKLKDIHAQQNVQLQRAQEAVWAARIDVSLSEETYWVANNDLKRVYEALKPLMEVYYGTELLSQMPNDERIAQLGLHPLLPFGLVVTSKTWHRANLDLKRLVPQVQAPVPIFIRDQMINDEPPTSYVLAAGNSDILSLDAVAFRQWRESGEQRLRELLDTLYESEKSVEHSGKMLEDLSHLLKLGLAADLRSEAERLAVEVEASKRTLTALRGQLERAQERIDMAEAEQRKAEGEMQQAQTGLDEVKRYIDEWKEESERRKRAIELEEALVDAEKEKVIRTAAEQDIYEKRESWRVAYQNWIVRAEDTVKNLTTVLSDATLPVPWDRFVDSDVFPELNAGLFLPVMNAISNHEIMRKSQENQNVELAILHEREKQYAEREQIHAQACELQRADWRNSSVSTEPMSVLDQRQVRCELRVREIKNKIDPRKEELYGLQADLNSRESALKEKAEDIKEKHRLAADPWLAEELDSKARTIELSLTSMLEGQIVLRSDLSTLEEDSRKYSLAEAAISALVGDGGELVFDDTELTAVRSSPAQIADEWKRRKESLTGDRRSQREVLNKSLRIICDNIDLKTWDAAFKRDLSKSLNQLETKSSANVEETLRRMIRFSEDGVVKLGQEKEKAERAQDFWASRAAMKAVAISDQIRYMVNKMTVKNEFGPFPLVKLERDVLPRRPEDCEVPLRDHFISAITHIVQEFETIDEGSKKLDDAIRKWVGDEEILLAALGRSYPNLLVYNMSTDNALTYGRPRNEYYSSWRTINQGSETKADGSGGQKLAARTIVMMMLLSMKAATDEHWTTLICDNPFANAVSAHVLDPIFEVAKQLRFQLIFVSPPELIQTDVSKRFPVYYKLDFREERGREMVTQTVERSFRTYVR